MTETAQQQGPQPYDGGGWRGPLRLASGSPRRRSLLSDAGFAVEQVVSGACESWPDLAVGPAAAAVAWRKLEAVLARQPAAHIPTVAADTVVVLGDEILCKPTSRADARTMLGRQSGQTVRVVTGVALAWGRRRRRLWVATRVTFRVFADQEINVYAAAGEGLDKAGGWGLQGVGMGLVVRATGSLSNVLGLPVAQTLAALARLGRR